MPEARISSRIREEARKAIRDFTLFDDTFMSIVFDENPECTEYVLGVILGKELKVVESSTQQQVKNLYGSSVRLDIKAVDSENRLYNIEVQRENKGAKPRRARYNGSLLDANCKDSGVYGEQLPETYVIFITERDYWKEGLPFYTFERNCTNSKNGIPFEDGLHIIYVNGEYRGSDSIGDLMHDFSCANPDEMKSAVLRKSTEPYKQDQQEAEKMCEAMERLNRMAIEEREEEIVLNLLKKNVPTETIADYLGFTESKVRKIQESLLAEA